MKITLEVYSPKYKPLDIVYVRNKVNKWGVFLKILDTYIEYSGFETRNGTSPGVYEIHSYYNCMILPGTISDTITVNSIHGYIMIDMHDTDDDSIYVGTGNKYTLFTTTDYGEKILDITKQAEDTAKITPEVENC